MDTNEQIEHFKEFIELHFKNQLYETIHKDKKSLVFSFAELVNFNHELADELLDNPEDTIRAAELAVEQFDLPEGVKNISVRFKELPEAQKIKISDIRSIHLGKFLFIEGIVRQASDVRPQITSAKFECAGCGNTLSILQIDTKFKEPSRCTCGWRGKFRLLSKQLIDVQHLKIEEAPESLEGGEQPKRLSVFLKEDLVDPKMEKRTAPGSKVIIYGIVKEVPIQLKTGAQSVRYDLILEANNIEPSQEDYISLTLTREDEEKILEFSKSGEIFNKFVRSIAPSIYGHDRIKEALVLQLFGGCRKEKPDKTTNRGDVHILLIGDPGSGKSQLLQFISKVAPKGRFVSGKGASGAGMTASVVKDEFLKGWSLEAGALPLTNKGICCLHPSTKLLVNNRIQSIERLYNSSLEENYQFNGELVYVNNISYSVPSFELQNLSTINKTSTKIRRKQFNGNLLNIKFNSGFEINLTKDHKLVNGANLIWKDSKDFKVGDQVLAPMKLDIGGQELLFLETLPESWKVKLDNSQKSEIKNTILKRFKNLAEFNRKLCIDSNYLSGGKQFTIYQFKNALQILGVYDAWKNRDFWFIRNKGGQKIATSKLIPELAYILGFAIGDGHFSSNKKKSTFTIYQSEVHKNFIERLQNYAQISFGKKFSDYIRVGLSPDKTKKVVTHHLYFNSNLLYELTNSLVGKQLENVLNFSNDCFKAFVAGLMDSDGCSSDKNSIKKCRNYLVQHINFLISNDWQTNLNFILSLRRFDLHAKLKRDRVRVLNVEITGRKDVHSLLSSICDYSIKARNKNLISRLANISSTSDKLPVDIVSEIANNLSKTNTSNLVKKGVWSYIYNYKNKLIRPSRDQLQKFLVRVGYLMSSTDKSLILNLLKRDFFLDEIVEIKEVVYNGYVYDLYVPETHNFLANGIIVHNCVDELDKIDKEDTAALHSAMEQQIIPINKANIQATLTCQTTLLAAANPKLGRFDPYTPIASQIDLPSTLINRFDLIFPVRDIPSMEKDEKIALHVLETSHKKEIYNTDVTPEFFRKYIGYSKQKIKPILSKEAIHEIKEFYVKLRNSGKADEAGIRPIPISARQLEGIVRLAEASAKVRLSDEVTRDDALKAIGLLHHCLMQVGFDPETGQIDIDRISTGISASTRSKIISIKEIIINLDGKGLKQIPIEEIMTQAASKGIEDSKVEEAIDQLKKSGDIFEPKRGYISRVG